MDMHETFDQKPENFYLNTPVQSEEKPIHRT